MNKISSIFDKIHGDLNQEVFDPHTKQIHPKVRLDILEQLHDLVPSNFTPHIQSVILMGSLAGYQYNDTSDIDIQIGLDHEIVEQIPWDRIKYKNGRMLPGTKHPINFNLRELYPPRENAQLKFPVSYDLINDKWLVLPDHPSTQEINLTKMDMPYLRLLAHSIGRDLAQMEAAYGTPRLKEEAQDVADDYKKLDEERKVVFRYALEPKHTTQDFAYKYIEHKLPEGEQLGEIERILRRKYNITQ